MIKAIIFDCFRVLIPAGKLGILRSFDPERTHEQQFKSLIAEHDLGKSLDWLYGEMSKVNGTPADELKSTVEKQPTAQKNTQLLDYIRSTLKPKYKIGMLSNVGPQGINDEFSPEDWALFDDKVLSFEVGIAKPNPKIYNLAAQRLNLAPEECLFVDDKPENVQAATSVGMPGIIYTDFDSFKHELEEKLK